MLYQNTQLNSDTLGMMKLSSTSSQIVEKIRVIQEIVLPKASKQIESVMNKQQGDEMIVFSRKKHFRKRIIDPPLLLPYNITKVDESCFEIKDSSILQEIFSMVSECLLCNIKSNIVEISERNQNKCNQTECKPKRYHLCKELQKSKHSNTVSCC